MPAPSSYYDNLNLIANGEQVEAGVTNRTVVQLKSNTDYLKSVLDTLSSNESIITLNRACSSSCVVGTPVYYNSANAQFEPAQATSAKRDCTGVVLSKPSSTTANIITSGVAVLDITPVLQGGDILTAGRFYLSETTAGKITLTPPTPSTYVGPSTTYQVGVLYADGVSRVYVLPNELLRGPQGAQGPTQSSFTQTATGTIANSTSETAISSTGAGSLTLTANSLAVGRSVRISARGIVSVTGTPTLTLKLKFGSTVVLSTGAVTMAAITNAGWSIDANITCRTVGASGTIFSQGYYLQNAVAVTSMSNTATTTIDTTASQAITLTAQWSAASASNTISCTNLLTQVFN